MSERVYNAAPPGALVAVSDSDAGPNAYRIGLAGTQAGQLWTVGERGPAGQSLNFLYLDAGEHIRVECDFNANKLTLLFIDKETGSTRSVYYPINGEKMIGTPVEVGQPVTVAFAFDDEIAYDETPEVTAFLATSGPIYRNEIAKHIGTTTDAVDTFSAARAQAQSNGNEFAPSAPPKTARATRNLDGSPSEDTELDPDELEDVVFDDTLPEGVQIIDPITGKIFVGRKWARENEITTINALTAAGYRMAMLRFEDGNIASLYPQYAGAKPGIQVRTPHRMIGRVLEEDAADQPLGPGHRIEARVERSLDGNTDTQGDLFTTPTIVVVVGVGPEVDPRIEADLPVDTTLAEFREPLTPRPAATPRSVGRGRHLRSVPDPRPAQPDRRRGRSLSR